MIIYSLTRPTVGSRRCVHCGNCLLILPPELGGKREVVQAIPEQTFDHETYHHYAPLIQLALKKCNLGVLTLEEIR